MSDRWPDSDGALAARFVDGLKLKHVTTACGYRSSILKPFQAFVTEQLGRDPLGPAIVAAWLRTKCGTWPLGRARIGREPRPNGVMRFLAHARDPHRGPGETSFWPGLRGYKRRH